MSSHTSTRAESAQLQNPSNDAEITAGPEIFSPPTSSFQSMEVEDGSHHALNASRALPRTDGGWGAWTYLAGATGLETLVWGFSLSYGVFLDHYETKYPESASLLAQVGTVANGSMYLLLTPITLIFASHPHLRPFSMWTGLVIMVSGLTGAAFSTDGLQLLFTQGILYGVGGTLLYCPVTSYMFEWWRFRRGLAQGIMYSGTGVGGLVMPLIISALLQRWGQRTTLISIAVCYALIFMILIPFIRPRLPLPARQGSRTPKIQWSFVVHKAFWLLWLGVLSQGLAAFMPATYLPAYASALILPSSIGTLSIALMNLARVPGQVLLGYTSDKIGPRKLILALAVLQTISVGAGWGSATNAGGLLGFALAFGSFAGSYTALFPRFINAIAEDDPNLPQVLYALFSFARGLGSIASGPLSTALINASGGLRGAKGGYGVEGYGALIIWTAASLGGSGIAAGFKGLKRD